MRSLTALALVAVSSGPALASDLVLRREKHNDPVSFGGQTRPARDSVQILWFGQDRMRSEEGNKVTIVRLDQKKMYLLDTEAKTCSTVDLPVDLLKYVPPEMVPLMQRKTEMTKVTLAPTNETRKIQGWSATRYTLTTESSNYQSTGTSPDGKSTATAAMVSGSTQDIWVTKDVGAGHGGWQDLYAAMMSASFSTDAEANEMRKLDGLPVLVESSIVIGGREVKHREAVTSVEEKDPPAGIYEVPAGFTDTPFAPMSGGTSLKVQKQ